MLTFLLPAFLNVLSEHSQLQLMVSRTDPLTWSVNSGHTLTRSFPFPESHLRSKERLLLLSDRKKLDRRTKHTSSTVRSNTTDI